MIEHANDNHEKKAAVLFSVQLAFATCKHFLPPKSGYLAGRPL